MGDDHWEVPYLPIDPADVGSSYQEVVRVNSQSGKGGVGFVLEQRFGISLPREMLVEFSKVVQRLTEELDREVRADEIMGALVKEYLVDAEPYRLIEYDLAHAEDDAQRCVARVAVPDGEVRVEGEGTGPIEAFVNGHGDDAERTAQHRSLPRAGDRHGQRCARDLRRGLERGGRQQLRAGVEPEHRDGSLDGDRLGGQSALAGQVTGLTAPR